MAPLPRTRRLTIVAHDPELKNKDGRVLMAEIEVPAEDLAPGPRGYRVHVIDYDTSTNTLYRPLDYPPPKENGTYPDPFKDDAEHGRDAELLADPRFHQQNVYAIVMRILARFEFALGRRVSWGFDGHQIHVAPHAFADANAFYSESDRALLFGYFADPTSRRGDEVVFTCLSHDVIAHETAHALLDGLRTRYTMPSVPEQMGFHEGFSDIIALLSIFSVSEVVEEAFAPPKGKRKSTGVIDKKLLTAESLRKSILFGLGEQFGAALYSRRRDSLRRSVDLMPLAKDGSETPYLERPKYREAHNCGEILVAAVMNAFLKVWRKRLEGHFPDKKAVDLDRDIVFEEGTEAAETLLTMIIRGLDYTPPTDIRFGDMLSAVLTSDTETVPDDSRYGYRTILRESFAEYGIEPTAQQRDDGTWSAAPRDLRYDRTHFDSLLRDRDEVFRFIWDNREALKLDERAYAQVESVRPCLRIGPDGFAVRETVAEYVEMVTLRADELSNFNISPPEDMPNNQEVTLYGGGTLIFDEYGRLKFQIRRRVFSENQTEKLQELWDNGYFSTDRSLRKTAFSQMHKQRSTGLAPSRGRRNSQSWQ
jgi:hypothetical protein